MAISVEEAPGDRKSTCHHCGNTFDAVRGFVYEDGNALAVYEAVFMTDHPGDKVVVSLSLGDWSENATGADRYRVGVNIWVEADDIKMSFVDPRIEKPDDVDLFGAPMKRDEALVSPDRDRFFHILEHVVDEDSRVAAFLA